MAEEPLPSKTTTSPVKIILTKQTINYLKSLEIILRANSKWRNILKKLY